MKIVVLGGTGNIGAQVVALLRERGHEVVAASPSTGVDGVTGVGLDEAFAGADAVVDTTNPRDFSEEAAVAFFATATTHVLDAEKKAGVGHHVALSVVGVDRDPGARGYLAGKVAQERLIAGGGVPATIVRATQFFEFLRDIADGSTVDGEVRVAPTLLQPVAAAAVARVVAEVAVAPAAGSVEVAGPERAPLGEFLRRVLDADGDALPVRVDATAGYFGRAVDETSLVPVGEARIDPLTLEEWLAAR
ncbi:NAD(P)H-binding protein [Microbacterium sp. M3]|uniref:NAD(P)H-binding protein n=1 Tax=Microbacterium arthrosphaerae TaxID=792652 RepID=A0ABU4GYH7_9MICO|nr:MULTISPECIES: NAD(P)H-binding protein [Microbacterium]MDW4572138.1 NAD(P)H-binding protein [Microbacterium arthrosphaerae]MDW7605993.1 NAD(P)H-binding protein [Microbacterium sp. M3]